MATKIVRTTVILAAEIVERIDRAVRAGKARSRNAFVAAALQHELDTEKAATIDAAFAAMATDEAYQAEAWGLAEAFVTEGSTRAAHLSQPSAPPRTRWRSTDRFGCSR